MDPSRPQQETQRQKVSRLNLGMLGKLVVITVLMFGFGYSMVPLYKKLCEVTGLNVLTPIDPDAAKFAKNTQVDASRVITVEFDANSQGPWGFRPKRNSLEIHPGELTTMTYSITNNQDRAMQAQAIPSYAPMQATAYFRKLECFCFKQQTLGAHQTREFPVVFVVDPKLPKDVKTITLSYTFFEVGAAQAVRPAPAAAGPPG
ncbi:MAG: cytochrome c oxidase assembly protein [Burkholderiaceae bacterium]|jgi:cytochrome c oxidase assembly protein subunit 11